MKKTIKYFYTIAAVIGIISFNSCSDETNELQTAAGPNGEIGAFARIIESSSDKSINLLDPTGSSWNATIEFVDAEDGALVESYTLYATFRDNTIDSDTAPNYSILNEVQVGSWSKDSFTAGDKYPMLSFEVKATDLISALGLDIANAYGGDTFVLRGEIRLSDGRTFSSTNSGNSINSELFYNDAFSFTSPFVCFNTPEPGDWTLEMTDLYGDGWNGGRITIAIDGEGQDYACDGDFTSVTINIPVGTEKLLFVYTAGSWEGENLYKFIDPNGNVVLEDGVGDWSNDNGPKEGEQFNSCD